MTGTAAPAATWPRTGASQSGSSFVRRTSGAWSGRLPELAERSVAAGIDHLTVGDHVSFADGHGADGLIQAAALLAADPRVSRADGRLSARPAPSRGRRAPARHHRSARPGPVHVRGRRGRGRSLRARAVRNRSPPPRSPHDGGAAMRAPVDVGRAGRLPRPVLRAQRSDPPRARDPDPGPRRRPLGRGARTHRAARRTAGWRCGSRRDGSRRRSAASKPSPTRLGEAASTGSTRSSSGRASVPRRRGRASG